MDKGTEVLSTSILNLDFLYYLIYLFFKSIWDFFVPGQEDGFINFINVWKHVVRGESVETPEEYSMFGEGLGAAYDGYSLFTPPHGLDTFGGFSGWLDVFFTNPYCAECASFFELFFGKLNAWLYLFVFLSFILLFFLKQRAEFLEAKENILYDSVYSREKKAETGIQETRWNNILELIKSTNPNDWKSAVMDADNILEETLEKNGFYGGSIGERLKSAKFSTIQDAWKGHLIRNKIAHQLDFNLTQREAKIAITHFGRVFNELK